MIDNRTRDSHRALHEKVFAVNDPALEVIAPQNSYGCRCQLFPITEYKMRKRGIDPDAIRAQANMPKRVYTEQYLDSKTLETKERRVVNLGEGRVFRVDEGWDYNPGEAFWKQRGMQPPPDALSSEVTPPEEQEIKPEAAPTPEAKPIEQPEAEPTKPEAKLKPGLNITNSDELKKVIKETCGEYMKNSNGVVLSVEQEKSYYFMGTDCKGTIYISTNTFPDSRNFTPNEHLTSALNKIANGGKLEWVEEYSIESLWHEITHNRQLGDAGGEHTKKRFIMEIVTQWTARRTYPEFLQALGGSAAHLDDIKSNGLGYRARIRHFNRLLEVLKIDEQDMFTEMKRLIDNIPCDAYGKELSGFLSAKSGLKKSKINKILGILEEWHFEETLEKMGLI